MSLDDLIAVSGLPGLYRIAANRSNGLIVEDLESGKRRFAPSRRHQFTPLASIAIYTDDGEAVELAKVFGNMRDQLADNPLPGPNASNEELYEYFADVLPNYDQERVYPGDIRKVIKWFKALQAANLLTEEEEEE
ncbi:MAG: hypothetical protein D6772_09605 [Bacteroidetes bacterium]|nr:MAG: hypothetical protein D6772_09605 [Bacteroidota bacterium]